MSEPDCDQMSILSNAAATIALPSETCAGSQPRGLGGVNWRVKAALILAAGVIYSLHIGQTLGASEAYTAMVATQSGYRAVIAAALRFDPGKPPLYPIVVHAFVQIFGGGDVALRAPSVVCTMIGVALMLALGDEMFGPSVGLAAAIFWAFSPLTVIYAQFARMYAMLMALSLAQILLMWRLRSTPSAGRVVLCGILGAAMLYTHLGSILFLGAEAAMLAGAASRGGRNRPQWLALAVSMALFLPFLSIAAAQVHGLIYGHWVDWIGPAHPVSAVRKGVVVVVAGALATLLTFGPRMETDENEPIRWCAALAILPIVVLTAGSLAIRPMFSARYVAPSLSLLMLLLARLLGFLGNRAFGLCAFGIACFLIFLLPYAGRYEPWRDMARQVSGGSPTEPVFFESGYVDSTAAETNPEKGFPQGFFRVPFDRYFNGRNPRLVIDPSSPQITRQVIAAAAIANHGAWLVSGLKDAKPRAEMPTGCFKIEKKVHSGFADLYQIKPITHCSGNLSGQGTGHERDAAAGAMPFKSQ
jgi:hypothetical protein